MERSGLRAALFLIASGLVLLILSAMRSAGSPPPESSVAGKVVVVVTGTLTSTPTPTATIVSAPRAPQAPVATTQPAPPPPAPWGGEAGTQQSRLFAPPNTGSGGDVSGPYESRLDHGLLPSRDVSWVYLTAAVMGLLGGGAVLGGLRMRHLKARSAGKPATH